MRLHHFVFFVASTVILGTVIGLTTGTFGLFGVHLMWVNAMVEGAFLSTTTLMGFWAYLMLNFVVRITLPDRVWRWSQVLLILVVLYDMLWFRTRFALVHGNHASTHADVWQAIWPLVAAAIVGVIRYRRDGSRYLIPTVFFLYVFTILDWLLVFAVHSPTLVNQTGFIMMICNIYMVITYSHLLAWSRPSVKMVNHSNQSAPHPRGV